MSPNRVALLCMHFYPEMISTGMHMTELSIGLTKLGLQVTVYCAKPSLILESDNPDVPPMIEYKGIKIIRVPTLGAYAGNLFSRFLFSMTYLLSTLLRVVMDTKTYGALLITTNPPFLGLVGRIAGWALRKPYIIIVYDVYPDMVARLGLMKPGSTLYRTWDKVARYILEGAARIVVIGRDMKEIIGGKLSRAARTRVRLIPNWSDEQTVYPVTPENNPFRRETNIPEGYFLLQYSGRMSRTHNLEPLIEAAALLQDEKVVFQFIGDGAKKEVLREMVVEHGLGNVQFLPYQPLAKLHEVLSAADMAVVCLDPTFTGLSVPSKTYGIMASGTPVLALVEPESEIGRVIQENEFGVVIKDTSAENLAGMILTLMRSPDRLKKMKDNAHRTFKENYTLGIAARRYMDVLAEACGFAGD